MIKRRKLGEHTISPRVPMNTGKRERVKLYDLLNSVEEFTSEYLRGAVTYGTDITDDDGFLTTSPTGLAYAIRLLVSHTADTGLVNLFFTKEEDSLIISMTWDFFAMPDTDAQMAVKRALVEAGFEVAFDLKGIYAKIKVDSTRALQLYSVPPRVIKSALYTTFFV